MITLSLLTSLIWAIVFLSLSQGAILIALGLLLIEGNYSYRNRKRKNDA